MSKSGWGLIGLSEICKRRQEPSAREAAEFQGRFKQQGDTVKAKAAWDSYHWELQRKAQQDCKAQNNVGIIR